MPAWSVRFQRTALVWLLLGSAMGATMLASRGLGFWMPWTGALSFHADVMLFGWMAQFTMGTAYWMLPKHAAGPERGSGVAIGAAWMLLNLGVLAVALGGPWGLVLPGRVAELAAVAAFAINAVPRIKPFGVGRQAH